MLDDASILHHDEAARPSVCPGCRHRRPPTDFPHLNCRSAEPSWADFCKDCWQWVRKRNNLKTMKFGDLFGVPHSFDVGDFLDLLAAQDGRCAICKFWPDFPLSQLCIDHCHTNGHVRGLLCARCNTGIGHFRDDPALLRAAAAFLEAAAARLEKAEVEHHAMPADRERRSLFHEN